MKINIEDNNNINDSIIGNNNQKKEKDESKKRFIEVLVEIVIGLIVAFLVYKFGWNK